MMNAIPNAGPEAMPGGGSIRKIAVNFARRMDNLGVAEKIYGIVALLVILMTFLVVMSIQSVRLQTAYRHLLASSASAAINIERVNGLIYAIVMESRGIYMSTERTKVRQFGDELLKRNRELAEVVAGWEETVRFDDAAQFSAFKQRVIQFIEFRKELVRRATQISPAAGREWGDNDANRALRSQLNADLEAFARIYADRAGDVTELDGKSRYASWYLFALGLGALMLAALNVFVMRRYVIGPLSQITEATALIAAGKIELDIPFVSRTDEIGHLARAVRNFRDAACRNLELEQLEIGTAKQRDTAMGERDKLTDKYHATKWQLSAAINSMPQGMIMLDPAAKVLAVNDQYRKIYGLPPTIKTGSSLQEILQHRAENGLFAGNVAGDLVAVVARIAKRQPSTDEISLGGGRVVSIRERPMDGGGVVAVHDDITEQRRSQRILERTEQFLATIIENVPQAIVAKDARNLRYVLVNRAAEAMIGMSRAEIMGKTARELFSAETAELIERRDRQLLGQEHQLDAIVDTVDNPVRGRRTVAIRRLQVGGPDRESHLFVSMIEDRTDQAILAGAAA
jgi:PAS domain S-box-containing protein